MTQEQVFSVIRQLLLFGGGFVVAKGWVDQETMLAIVGILATAGASFWALKTRTKAAIVTQAATYVPVPVASQYAAGIDTPVQPTPAPTGQ